MGKLQLKNKIIKRINQIDDIQLLISIENLFNTSDKDISKLLSFLNENLQHENINEKEDFTDYIKEWVKSM